MYQTQALEWRGTPIVIMTLNDSPCHRCDRFSGYLAEGFLVCAIHPCGPDQNPCPDFVEVVEN